MDHWAARGAIQLALMDGGFDVGSVTVAEMQIVVDRLLRKQLESQNVGDVGSLCQRIREALGVVGESSRESLPDRIFERLGKARSA